MDCNICYETTIDKVCNKNCNTGHFICTYCYFQLKEKICPICRKNYKPHIVPDTNKRREILNFIKLLMDNSIFWKNLLILLTVDDFLSKIIIQIIHNLRKTNVLIEDNLMNALEHLSHQILHSELPNNVKIIYTNELYLLRINKCSYIFDLETFKNFASWLTLASGFYLMSFLFSDFDIYFLCCKGLYYQYQCLQYYDIISRGNCGLIATNMSMIYYIANAMSFVFLCLSSYNLYDLIKFVTNKNFKLKERNNLHSVPFVNTITH